MIPKFRAWDKALNEMNYKVMVGNCDTDDENWTCPIIWIEERQDWLHFDDYECIMQSTGLKDKNGKEIFEGDILGTKDGLLNGIIEYREDLGMFVNSLIRYNNFERLCNVASDREIIGNIYENKELLDA
jgi:hypothetical protein|nr:MAG TPA: YopX protein [Caudoviricetes sp.]